MSGIAALRGAAEGVRRLALFSSNESADDVATGDLKYLLVPFYLAEARARTSNVKRSLRSACATAPLRAQALIAHRAPLPRSC